MENAGIHFLGNISPCPSPRLTIPLDEVSFFKMFRVIFSDRLVSSYRIQPNIFLVCHKVLLHLFNCEYNHFGSESSYMRCISLAKMQKTIGQTNACLFVRLFILYL